MPKNPLDPDGMDLRSDRLPPPPACLAAYTAKQRKAITEFFRDYNPQAAGRRAGYINDDVEYYDRLYENLAPGIEAYGKEVLSQAHIENGRIARELAILAFHNPRDYFRQRETEEGEMVSELRALDELGDAAKAIQSIERITNDKTGRETLKVKFYSKKDALELLGKAGSLFKESTSSLPPMVFEVNIGGENT